MHGPFIGKLNKKDFANTFTYEYLKHESVPMDVYVYDMECYFESQKVKDLSIYFRDDNNTYHGAVVCGIAFFHGDASSLVKKDDLSNVFFEYIEDELLKYIVENVPKEK